MKRTFVTTTTSLIDWWKYFESQKTQLYLFVAANMQANRGMLFRQSGAYNGHMPWKPLKLRQGQPLKDTGTLSKSIGPVRKVDNGVRPIQNTGSIVRYGQEEVTIGTSLAYARLMNDGGTITPKKKPVLWIPLPDGKSASKETKNLKKNAGKGGGPPIVKFKDGKTFMLAKKVVVPARNFEEWNQADKDELKTSLTNEVARVLNVTR